MTEQRHSGIEGWLERRYARVGLRYLYEYLGVLIAWTLGVFVLATAGLTFYFDGGISDFLLLVAGTQLLTLIFLPLGFVLWMRTARPAIAWMKGERSAELAPGAWAATLAAPMRAPLIAYAQAIPAQIGWSFYAESILDTGLGSVPVIAGAAAVLTGVSIFAVSIFAGQLVVRPVLREIEAYLPRDFAFARSRLGLAQQLVIRLTVIGLVMTFVGGAVAVVTDEPLTRFVLAFTLAPAILALIGAVAFPLAAISLVGPVDELIAATRRVTAGDLTARVPVVTSDELGELSQSFNEMTADLRRTTDDLRESRARIVAASDDSRRRVERDLHDGAQQDLVLLNLKLGLLAHKTPDDQDAAALVEEARADLRRALEQLRDLAHGIYPAVLENDGLSGALADAARRSAIPVAVECDGAARYARELEAAVYFCCLEALQNAGKYAGDHARATVRLRARESTLEFEVADDGSGFDVPAGTSSTGLQNMSDRIGALGGELTIESAPGRGTTVSGRIPVA